MSVERNHFNIGNLCENKFTVLLIIYSFTVALLVYGGELANFTLSIDEEIHSFNLESWSDWIRQGRWGMGVLVYVMPQGLSTIPFLPTFLFIIGLCFSSIIFSRILSVSGYDSLVFVGVFVSSPIWLHIAEFNTLSWGFSLGLFVTATASKYIDAGGAKNALLAGVLMGFSLAVYQAFLVMYLMVAFLACIKEEWSAPVMRSNSFILRVFNSQSIIALSVVISVFVYYSLNSVFLYFSNADIVYLDNFVKFSSYFGDGRATAIASVVSQLKGLLFGGAKTFLDVGVASLFLFWLGGVLVLWRVFDRRVSIVSKIYILVLSVSVFLLAVSLIILSAGIIPLRALVAFPILYAVLSALAINFFDKAGSKLLVLLVVLFSNIYIAHSLFYADQVVRQRDLIMATRLIERVEDVGRTAFGENIPIVVVGQWRHEEEGPALRVEIFGASFFEHDGGNPYRVAAYLRLLGLRGIKPLSISELRNEMNFIHSKPSWPDKESVFLAERAVVIKLSEPSYSQELTLSRP